MLEIHEQNSSIEGSPNAEQQSRKCKHSSSYDMHERAQKML